MSPHLDRRKLWKVPVSIRVDVTRRRVEVTSSGILTGEEMQAAQEEIVRSAGFERDFDALFDLTGVSAVEMSTKNVRTVADNSAFAASIRRAFVMTNQVAFGMMRMLVAYLGESSGEVEMFEDRDAAERWLDRQKG